MRGLSQAQFWWGRPQRAHLAQGLCVWRPSTSNVVCEPRAPFGFDDGHGPTRKIRGLVTQEGALPPFAAPPSFQTLSPASANASFGGAAPPATSPGRCETYVDPL
uniref:Uncharacterized protein n=1 Tax=Eutreptiella gymnastica TaxID=73025 RepID=A0A7S4LCV3_9EUGL